MTVDAPRATTTGARPRATAPPAPPPGDRGAPAQGGTGPWRSTRRRRRLPYLTVGSVLVIACVLGFAWTSVQLGDRISVLAVAEPVAAGQPISAADLTEVSAVEAPGLAWIAASHAEEVIGRTAAVPLVPGTLLTDALLGEPRFPPRGQTMASVALKAGQFPRGTSNGARVTVFLTNNTGQAAGDAQMAGKPAADPPTLEAVVLDVSASTDGQGDTVVSLLLAADDAPKLAAAPPAGLVLMQTAPGGN